MATLADLREAGQETGPTGDFYSWVLKRYQRIITRLVLLLVVLVVGFALMAFWFASRLSALEERPVAPSTASVQGPTLKDWQASVDASAERDAALERKLTATNRCLNENVQALDQAVRQLLAGRLDAQGFLSGFKLRSCG
jgi:hypothetical protein